MKCLICNELARNTIMETTDKGNTFCTECFTVGYPALGNRPIHSHYCDGCKGVWECADSDCKLKIEHGCNINKDICNLKVEG